MITAVAVVGGWAHPATQTGPALADALEAIGVSVTVCDGSVAAADALRAATPDLLVVHTCRFQMLDARYTAEQRASYAELTPPSFVDAVVAHLGAGRPLLGLHTAPISFDDWPHWPAVLGATWHWDRSNHPPPGPFTVQVGAAGIDAFTVVDELYRFVMPAPGAQVVATAVDAEGIEHPQAWLHHAPSGARVAYSALGHDERSLGNAAHRVVLSRIVTWLTTEGDAWPT